MAFSMEKRRLSDPSTSTDNLQFHSFQRSGSSSSSSSNAPVDTPPSYEPPMPQPFICGFMDKCLGDYMKGTWKRKYVEVSKGVLRFFQSREDNYDTGVPIFLANCYVSVQDRRNVMLDLNENTIIFRAPSELSAQTWVNAISQFCMVAPTAEDFCKKLSHRKKILEERYLRLRADGILSWYKSEKDDGEACGSLQVRGEGVILDTEQPHILYLETTKRRYLFGFEDKRKAKLWFDRIIWHSHRKPLNNSLIKIRNPSVSK